MPSNSEFAKLDSKIDAYQRAHPEAMKNLMAHINKYMEATTIVLSKIDMVERPRFDDDDQSVFAETLGLTDDELDTALKNTLASDVKKGWAMWQYNRYLAFTLLMRWLSKEKRTRELEAVSLYGAIMMYATLHRKFWKHQPSETVMRYTIAHISDRFLLRRLKSVLAMVKHISDTNNKNAESRLHSSDDGTIFGYVRDLRIRMNNFIMNIARKAYKNGENGNYLNVDHAMLNGKEGEYRNERNSLSSDFTRIISSFDAWFYTNRIDSSIVSVADKAVPELKRGTISSVMEQLKADKSRDLLGVLGILFRSIYKVNTAFDARQIHSSAFVAYAIKTLSIHRGKNTEESLKTSVNSVLAKNVPSYRSLKSETHRGHYRKALIIYLALGVQKATK